MAIRKYPRTIDLVQRIRMDRGIPRSIKYAKGRSMYENILFYIKEKFNADHRQAMDAVKYFMF